MNDVKECWKIVVGAPAYSVSSEGRVQRLDTGRMLSLTPRPNGYVNVSLSVSPGRKVRFYVHRLVAQAFIGDLTGGMQVNHKNFVRSDNSAANLEIVTCAENAAYSNRAGRHAIIGRNTPRGENSCRSKLNAAQVDEIRAMRARGALLGAVAAQFGISKTQVSNIINGKSWRDSIGAFAFRRDAP